MGLKIEYFYISDSTNHFSQPNLIIKKLKMFLAKHFLTSGCAKVFAKLYFVESLSKEAFFNFGIVDILIRIRAQPVTQSLYLGI